MDNHQPLILSQKQLSFWLLGLLSLFLLFAWAQWTYLNYQNKEDKQLLSDLLDEKVGLENELKRLEQQATSLSMETQDLSQQLNMNNAVNASLLNDVQELQAQVMMLNKELLFYQNITQGNHSSDLQVRELQLIPSPQNNDYLYRAVLTQGKKIKKPITGKLYIQLNFANEKSRLLPEREVELKHVQVLEGSLAIEDNEQPQSIEVTLKSGKKVLTQRTFEWTNLIITQDQ